MRGTITCLLLLSLGLPFHCVCSDTDAGGDQATPAQTAAPDVTTVTTVTVKDVAAVEAGTVVSPTGTTGQAVGNKVTITPTSKSNIATTLAPTTVKLTDKPAATTVGAKVEPVVGKVATTPTPNLNPVTTPAPTTVQLPAKPATTVATITSRATYVSTTTTLPSPQAVGNSGTVPPTTPTAHDSKMKPTTTMTSRLTGPGQDSTSSVTHTTSSSKESKGGTVADVTTKMTSVVSPAQATSRTSQPPGGTVTKPSVTSIIVHVATPGQTSTTGLSPTNATPPKRKTVSFTMGTERSQEPKEGEKELEAVCRRLMKDLQAGICTLTLEQHNGKPVFDNVEIRGIVKGSIASQHYEELTKKPNDNTTLIAILASCGALLAMIIGLAIYASHHRKPYNENQQHLTEELHTVENGYHDNPTLEVMEVQPEMQEKKMALNGECNDSWIVPIDNLLKEDLPDEEDTHL